MRKMILITGNGQGKTLLATLLERHYGLLGIPHLRLCGAELTAEETRQAIRGITNGCIILDGDPWAVTADPEFTPWQTIKVQGGIGLEPDCDLSAESTIHESPSRSGAPGNSPYRAMGSPDLHNGPHDASFARA